MTTREILAARIRALADSPDVLPATLAAACLDVACEVWRDLGWETNGILEHVRRHVRRERGGDA